MTSRPLSSSSNNNIGEVASLSFQWESSSSGSYSSEYDELTKKALKKIKETADQASVISTDDSVGLVGGLLDNNNAVDGHKNTATISSTSTATASLAEIRRNRKRKMDAVYARERRKRERSQEDTLQKQFSDLRLRNMKLQEESKRLEEILREVQIKVARIEQQKQEEEEEKKKNQNQMLHQQQQKLLLLQSKASSSPTIPGALVNHYNKMMSLQPLIHSSDSSNTTDNSNNSMNEMLIRTNAALMTDIFLRQQNLINNHNSSNMNPVTPTILNLGGIMIPIMTNNNQSLIPPQSQPTNRYHQNSQQSSSFYP